MNVQKRVRQGKYFAAKDCKPELAIYAMIHTHRPKTILDCAIANKLMSVLLAIVAALPAMPVCQEIVKLLPPPLEQARRPSPM